MSITTDIVKGTAKGGVYNPRSFYTRINGRRGSRRPPLITASTRKRVNLLFRSLLEIRYLRNYQRDVYPNFEVLRIKIYDDVKGLYENAA